MNALLTTAAGFLAAYSASCERLAADLDKARTAPLHIAEMTVVLLWTWRAAVQSFDTTGAAAASDAAMQPLLLPVLQLAGAGGCNCCWQSHVGRGRRRQIEEPADCQHT